MAFPATLSKERDLSTTALTPKMNKYVTIIAKGDGLFAMPDPANDDKLPTTLFPSRMILIIQKVFLVPLLEKFKMKFTFLLFSFAVANLFKATVDGALMIYDNVYCSRIAPNETATVCAVAQYLTPYPESFENGTIVWVGEYRSIYTIVKGLKEGDVYDAWVPGRLSAMRIRKIALLKFQNRIIVKKHFAINANIAVKAHTKRIARILKMDGT